MTAALKRRDTHIWALDAGQHYVEPEWCSARLLEDERFTGNVLDPCAGFGRIPQAAREAGLIAHARDIVDRGCVCGLDYEQDFLAFDVPYDNIIFNPPFTLIRQFGDHALTLAKRKVAMIVPARRLNAMGRGLATTPLYRIRFLTPRPSMPPGWYISAGGKVGGGTADYAWLIWLQGYNGEPAVKWLHRDGGPGT
jgi:hypothetical protein